MSYLKLPEKTINDLNSPADINQLQLNLDALKGGVNTDQPVSNIATLNAAIIAVGDGIIESGSNTNGYYVKFKNGTLICMKGLILFPAQAISTDASVTWGYPSSFYTVEAVIVLPFSQYNGGGSQGDVGLLMYNGIYNSTTATYNTIKSYAYRNATVTGVYLNAIAIGRWKA